MNSSNSIQSSQKRVRVWVCPYACMCVYQNNQHAQHVILIIAQTQLNLVKSACMSECLRTYVCVCIEITTCTTCAIKNSSNSIKPSQRQKKKNTYGLDSRFTFLVKIGLPSHPRFPNTPGPLSSSFRLRMTQVLFVARATCSLYFATTFILVQILFTTFGLLNLEVIVIVTPAA